MDFHILTLFPEMIEHAAGTSILGRAIKSGCIKLNISNIRDFSVNKHMRVDDYPYGGGAGMVIEAEPVFRAVQDAKRTAGEKARVIYLTPQAEVLDQNKVEELAREESLILLCGHYEGIDERVLQEVVTDYVSIGDYVLTGGELPALVLMDAVSRFVPGVLSNEESSQFESMQDNLLEYPHYTRPQSWHGREVPEVLLSGDHDRITKWRYAASVERTAQRRPDLLEISRKVYIICLGSENAKTVSEEICNAVSRYGTVLDYNRAKLQKEKRKFTPKDMVIFVFDEEKISDAEAFEKAFRNIGADNTPAFCIVASDVHSIEESGKDAADVFEKKGMLQLGTYVIPEETNYEAIAAAALDIRKKAGSIRCFDNDK